MQIKMTAQRDRVRTELRVGFCGGPGKGPAVLPELTWERLSGECAI